MIYACCDEKRRAAVLGNPALNGIDYLEVLDHEAPAGSPRQQTLLIYCLKAAPTGLTTANVLIVGGESVTNVAAVWIAPASEPPPLASAAENAYFATLSNLPNILVVRTNVYGDFSPYTLRLVNDATQAAEDLFDVTEALSGFDPLLSEVEFSFKVECGPDFDCAPVAPSCAAQTQPPPINYLAKDYGSFRTVILDRLSQLLPSWQATSEADIGVVLAELLAYAADQLSYRQDAVTTEAYLLTARSRISLRRHALLVDYPISDGCNARAFMQIDVSAQTFLDHTKILFFTLAPGMPAKLAGNEQAALDADVVFFEPMQDAELYPDLNRMEFYTWGDDNCCLPQGATQATLLDAHPNLQPGDLLIFQEVMGPQTGFAADADIRHRCAVRLTAVATTDALGNPLVDPLFEAGTGKPIVSAAQQPTPVTEIQWSEEDALPFALCVSSKYRDSTGKEQTLQGVSAANGNVVLADQGLTMPTLTLPTVPAPSLFQTPSTLDRCNPTALAPFPPFYRPQLPTGPLTQAVPLPLAGAPSTSAPVPLVSQGYISLMDASGLVCLMARATNPAAWPAQFAVKAVQSQTNPANFDVRVVFDAASQPEVVLEAITNLTLAPNVANNAITQINAQSQLLSAPATQPAFAGNPASFNAQATPFAAQGSIELADGAQHAFLALAAKSPLAWPPQFALLAQGDLQHPTQFNLLLLYQPTGGGVGVQTPVVVQTFPDLSLATIGAVPTTLITLLSFEQGPSPSASASALMSYDARNAGPVITLTGDGATWTPTPDLLNVGETDPNFVVEVEADGIAHLRFGDFTNAINGRSPAAGTVFTATIRLGNGTSGNVGAESLTKFSPPNGAILACRNPLPATGGVDPETNEQIRRRAPQAFMTQERAVVSADYATAAMKASAQIEDAAADLRWTGSWRTAFVAAEPMGGGDLTRALRRDLYRFLNGWRLAGQDIKIESPDYVPLEITLNICVDPSYFQADVRDGVKRALCSGDPSSGRAPLFAPGSFELGQTVYLSPIYAAARRVAGVRTVLASVFQPQGVGATDAYLRRGEIPLGPFQVARLDNDPSLPNHGRLTLAMTGGK
jgi:hypothetical protein